MPVDFLAGETHYLDHLHPIWQALRKQQRGTILLFKSSPASDSSCRLRSHATSCEYEGCAVFPAGVRAGEVIAWLRQREGPLVVASINDARLAERSGRPLVFCEHGAGQTYSNRDPSYAGGVSGRRRVALFICPNEAVAVRNRTYYPAARSVVVGCPRLDSWHRRPPKSRSTPPVVALSFHWDAASVCPEARWAWPHYKSALLAIAKDKRWRLLGHGHPRALGELRGAYAACDVPVVERFDQVMEQADVYVCDNSSTIFEFASLDRPVVVLNAPWYRREVRHGLRFWDASEVGINCSEPDEVTAAIALALEDHPAQQEARRRAVALAYAYTDGRAAQRAARAINELC